MYSYDVLIIGGGLVGNSLALAVSNHAKTAVIEAKALKDPPIVDERALALSYSTQLILQALDVWKTLAPHAAPIHQVHVSDAGHFGATRFSAENYGITALGHVVNAQKLTNTLRDAVVQNTATTTLFETHVEKIIATPGGYHVHTQTPSGAQLFTTKLLVAADGIHSQIRRWLGIAAELIEYPQSALTARAQISQNHQGIAYERFADSAVLATLPGTNEKEVNLIWTVDKERATEICILPDQEFCQQFSQAFGHRLGKLLHVEKRQSHALRSLHAKEQVRPHAVLLGNSAHTLHPVAAQGFNLSLRDVAALAQIIRDACKNQTNPGELTQLMDYQKQRYKEQSIVMNFTQGLVTLFGKTQPPYFLLRDLGLTILETMPFAKNVLAKQALGIANNLPKWVSAYSH